MYQMHWVQLVYQMYQVQTHLCSNRVSEGRATRLFPYDADLSCFWVKELIEGCVDVVPPKALQPTTRGMATLSRSYNLSTKQLLNQPSCVAMGDLNKNMKKQKNQKK